MRLINSFLVCLATIPTFGCQRELPEMPRGWYYAGKFLQDDGAFGGFTPFDNLPKKCKNDYPGRGGEFSLIAYPNEEVEFLQRKAFLLRLVNRTEKVAQLLACDGKMYIIHEALDTDGKWKPLETFPWSDCGSSYYQISLGANEYWEFFAARRKGELNTKLRFRIATEGVFADAVRGQTIYSNEYDGSIDKGAFVRSATLD